jgi:putative MATE family efflux protein
MVAFTLYLLADLYFVGKLGPDAIAAIAISGNALFIHLGLSTILGTGAMALIAQAFGRKDYHQAAEIFRQSLMLGSAVGLTAAITGLIVARPFITFFGGTGQALQWGVEYFQVFCISFNFLILLYIIGASYRGMGDTKTPFLVMLQANVLNIVLDPILIFGFAGVPALGVRGAAIASLLAQLYALVVYTYLIFIKPFHLSIRGSWRLKPRLIKKSLSIGLPSGFTHFLLAFNLMIQYRVISDYGTAALASLGVGFRIFNAVYLPVIAIGSAMAAIVGQNFGAKNYARISATFWFAWLMASGLMLLSTVTCWIIPGKLIAIFSNDPEVIYFGIIYLTIMSLGNIGIGTIMTVNAAFQGLGKTYPGLISALTNYALFTVFVFTLPVLFGWGIQAVWWIKIVTAGVEMVIIALWLRNELMRVRSELSINFQPSQAHSKLISHI